MVVPNGRPAASGARRHRTDLLPPFDPLGGTRYTRVPLKPRDAENGVAGLVGGRAFSQTPTPICR